ncbi:hypothetical protein DL95DRAFT_385498, partial [Leptodontidium sp. 2 PMI_412]
MVATAFARSVLLLCSVVWRAITCPNSCACIPATSPTVSQSTRLLVLMKIRRGAAYAFGLSSPCRNKISMLCLWQDQS